MSMKPIFYAAVLLAFTTLRLNAQSFSDVADSCYFILNRAILLRLAEPATDCPMRMREPIMPNYIPSPWS